MNEGLITKKKQNGNRAVHHTTCGRHQTKEPGEQLKIQ